MPGSWPLQMGGVGAIGVRIFAKNRSARSSSSRLVSKLKTISRTNGNTPSNPQRTVVISAGENRSTGFFPQYPGYDWGALAAWAWAASRCVDYLQTQPFCNPNQIALTGHSRLGKVTLVARAAGAEIELAVRDSGIGFRPSDEEQLFRKFSRLNAGAGSSYYGTGLGLFIVQRLMQLTGGRVSASSAGLGSGAEFLLHWPRAEIAPAGVPARQA